MCGEWSEGGVVVLVWCEGERVCVWVCECVCVVGVSVCECGVCVV